MSILGYALLAYVIGSIPSGLIIGKLFFNTDVRLYGSKNIGATNTYRVIVFFIKSNVYDFRWYFGYGWT